MLLCAWKTGYLKSSHVSSYNRATLLVTYFGFDFSTESHKLNFATFKDVSIAFTTLFKTVQKELKSYKDFEVIKTASMVCVNQKLSKELKNTQDIDSLFQVFAENRTHCNWQNVRFLEIVATASGNRKLSSMIAQYKDVIFCKIKAKYYSKLQTSFIGKDPDNVTVKQLKKMHEPYFISDVKLLSGCIEDNGLRTTWLIPTNTVHQTYLSALIIPQESQLDSYLQIGDWVIHHPLCVLPHLHKELS